MTTNKYHLEYFIRPNHEVPFTYPTRTIVRYFYDMILTTEHRLLHNFWWYLTCPVLRVVTLCYDAVLCLRYDIYMYEYCKLLYSATEYSLSVQVHTRV